MASGKSTACITNKILREAKRSILSQTLALFSTKPEQEAAHIAGDY
jgi:hypothetical protein